MSLFCGCGSLMGYWAWLTHNSQLEDCVFDPQPKTELLQHSLGNSFHLNCSYKKQISGFFLLPIATTKK